MRTKLALLIALPTTALAQDAATPDSATLKEIVLIATGLPTEVFRSPSSVSVITAADIARKGAASVGALLAEVPGVFVEEQGIERVRIRGESSRRTAVLIDGQKLTDHTGYGQPVLIDPASIERIEVVRGASSVVAGTQAIGGVVNIVTKKGADKPLAGEIGLTGFSATGGYRADDAEDCAAKREVVGQILAASGARVIAVQCGQTEQGFTPFSHAAPADAFVHRWHVHLTEGGPVIRPLAKGEACAERRDVMQPSWCAVSAQEAR